MAQSNLSAAEAVEDISENDADFEAALPDIVRLKEGFQLRDANEGTTFEIDTDDLREQNEADVEFDVESLNFAKYDLLGNDDDDDDQSSPFDKLRRQMVDVTGVTPGSVVKKIIRAGDGLLVPAKSTVTVHYNGYMEYAAEPFDSTSLRGKGHTFRLDTGAVIMGLDHGICTMKRGEKSQFLINHEYAFGPMGCPPRIPPEATVLFEVELITFVNDGALVDFDSMTLQEQRDMSFANLYKVCVADQQAGNDYAKKQQHSKAALRYEHGAKLMETCILHNEAEQIKCDRLLSKLLVNLAIVKDQMGLPRRAATFSKRALAIDKNNIKALFRLGRCQNELGEFNSAKATLMRAKQIEPNNVEILNELQRLNANILRAKIDEKQLCVRMMAPLTKGLADAKKEENEQESITKQLNAIPVTDEFKDFADKQLAMFAVDDSRNDLILPEGLNVQEQSYVTFTAKLLKLKSTFERREGCIRVKVYKQKD